MVLYKPDWIKNWSQDLVERVAYVEQLYPVFSIHHIYPWKEEISTGIDYADLCYAQFTQPDLFIRLRPGKEELVKQKLKSSDISFTTVGKSGLALANGTKLDSILQIDEEAVIQD